MAFALELHAAQIVRRAPVMPSAHARIDELVDHHGRRLDKSLQALCAGADTAYEVALQLRWTRRELSFDPAFRLPA